MQGSRPSPATAPHEPIGPFAVALEVRLVIGRRGFDLGQLRLQRFDAGLQHGGDRPVTGR